MRFLFSLLSTRWSSAYASCLVHQTSEGNSTVVLGRTEECGVLQRTRPRPNGGVSWQMIWHLCTPFSTESTRWQFLFWVLSGNGLAGARGHTGSGVTLCSGVASHQPSARDSALYFWEGTNRPAARPCPLLRASANRLNIDSTGPVDSTVPTNPSRVIPRVLG